MPGQSVSGDLHLVVPFNHGMLLAVVDGIGHGPEATRAAELAVESLSQRPQDSVHALINRCHAALGQTRGVVLTLMSVNTTDHTITCCGVGNVEGLVFRADKGVIPQQESVLLRGGVVGAQLPVLYASVIPVYPGDLLLLASDGIRAEFERDVIVQSTAQRNVETIMRKHFKGTDDALVLAARYMNGIAQ